MVETDLAIVCEIEQASYRFPWSDAIFRDCLRMGYSCWVLELHNVVSGYGIISMGAGESHLLNLCVSVMCRRRGMGRTLLQHLLVEAKRHRASSTWLEVRPSNHQAVELYRTMGFNEVGFRRGYYPAEQGRENALVMARSL